MQPLPSQPNEEPKEPPKPELQTQPDGPGSGARIGKTAVGTGGGGDGSRFLGPSGSGSNEDRFGRLSRRAKSVLDLAEAEAKQLRRSHIGTECLLIALALESYGIAAKALAASGINADRLRGEVQNLVGLGYTPSHAVIPFSPRCNSVCLDARVIANDLKDDLTDTEHLLLALLERTDSHGSKILDNLGVDKQQLASTIFELADKKELCEKAAAALDIRQGDVLDLYLDGVLDPRSQRAVVVIANTESIIRLQALPVVPLLDLKPDAVRNPLDFELAASSEEGLSAGLEGDKLVACSILCTYPKSWFTRRVGTLPQKTLEEICARVWKLVKPPGDAQG